MFQYNAYFKQNSRYLRLTLKREARNIIINFEEYI